MAESKLDTFNKFGVGLRGASVMTLRPLPQVFTAQEAFLLAAYLVCMAEALCNPEDGTWEQWFEAVQNT